MDEESHDNRVSKRDGKGSEVARRNICCVREEDVIGKKGTSGG